MFVVTHVSMCECWLARLSPTMYGGCHCVLAGCIVTGCHCMLATCTCSCMLAGWLYTGCVAGRCGLCCAGRHNKAWTHCLCETGIVSSFFQCQELRAVCLKECLIQTGC